MPFCSSLALRLATRCRAENNSRPLHARVFIHRLAGNDRAQNAALHLGFVERRVLRARAQQVLVDDPRLARIEQQQIGNRAFDETARMQPEQSRRD